MPFARSGYFSPTLPNAFLNRLRRERSDDVIRVSKPSTAARDILVERRTERI